MKRLPILFTVFTAALLLRLLLLFIDYSWDVNNHISWAEDLIRNRFSESFYTTISTNVFGSKYPNYPPLSLFLFYLLYPLQSFIHSLVWWANVTIPVFPSQLIFFVESKTFLAGLFKIPSILADFGIVWLLILFAKKLIKGLSQRQEIYIALLFLFNPIVFYNSAFWGQIDSIPLFFLLSSLYLGMFTKQTILSILIIVISLLIKPNTIIYLPVYTYVLIIKNHSWKSIFLGGTVSLLLFYISFIPFNSNPGNILSPFILYWKYILDAQSLSLVSNGAFNFWVLILLHSDIVDSTLVGQLLSYKIVGYFLFIGNLSLSFYYIMKDKNVNNGIIYGFFFTSLTAFLFLTRMHERYVILLLPFLVLMVIQNKKLWPWFIVLTVAGFLNMYNSWPVPTIPGLKPLLENQIVYKFIAVAFIICFIGNLILYRFEKVLKNVRRKI